MRNVALLELADGGVALVDGVHAHPSRGRCRVVGRLDVGHQLRDGGPACAGLNCTTRNKIDI